MQANGINYYKGVLLCSRPNESPTINLKRQFCARVFPHQQLGLVPVKQYDEKKTKKRVFPVLNNHKKWLEQFKKNLQDQKQQEEKDKEKAIQRLEKIKQEGYEERQRAKKAPETKQQQSKAVQLQVPEGKHKKKDKPMWAKTAQEVEHSTEMQVDELIDFFNAQQKTELKDYVSDEDVKSLLLELKVKIQKLKEQEDWKSSQLKKIQQNRQIRDKMQAEEKEKDDVLSRISKQSGAQSVASQKTAERVEQLQRKKKAAEWDKLTSSEKQKASVDEQIAKNIADQILRNYPVMKHHSNQSIRHLIQKHAHEQVKS